MPDELAQEIRTLLRRISMMDGVIEVTNAKYWIESPGNLVGMITIQAHRSADPEHVLRTARPCVATRSRACRSRWCKDPSLEWMDE